MGIFGGLVNTWKNGYQLGDITKSLLYDLNPIAWAGDALVQKLRGDDDFDFFNNNVNWEPSASDPIDQGLNNAWNKITGNSHLTPEYQHQEQMEMNKNQITAQDLTKAGISKYALSPVGFSSPSTTGKGGDMLQAILATQQIASQAQALKEQKYNYSVSKRLGIRTGDTNALAQYLPFVKLLTGKDLSDVPEGGILGVLADFFQGKSMNSNIGASANIDTPKTGIPFTAPSLPTSLHLSKWKNRNFAVLGSKSSSNESTRDFMETQLGIDTSPKVDFSVFPDEFKRSATSFVSKMLSDGKWNSDNIDLLAFQLSKRYSLNKSDVLDYLFDVWDRIHGQY